MCACDCLAILFRRPLWLCMHCGGVSDLVGIAVAGMDWDAMIEGALDNVTCDIVAGGLEIVTKHLQRGMQYSVPVYKSGYRILLSSSSSSTDIWNFLSVFHWSLWVAVLVTMLFMGVALYATDVVSLKRHTRVAPPGLRGMVDSQWYSWGLIGTVTSLEPDSLGARVLAIAYGWVLVIVLTAYTANTAALTATRYSNSNIQSIEDLVGRKVGAYLPEGVAQPVEKLLEEYAIKATPVPWETEEDERLFMKELEAGRLDALVIDSPFVEYMSSVDCMVRTVGPLYMTFPLALAFPPNAPDLVVDGFSKGLLEGQAQLGMLDQLENRYIRQVSAKCVNALQGGDSEDDVQRLAFRDVAGMWVVLSIAVGMGLLLMLCNRCGWACMRARSEMRHMPQRLATCSSDMGTAAACALDAAHGAGEHGRKCSPLDDASGPRGEPGSGQKALGVGAGGPGGRLVARGRSLQRTVSSQVRQRAALAGAGASTFARAFVTDLGGPLTRMGSRRSAQSGPPSAAGAAGCVMHSCSCQDLAGSAAVAAVRTEAAVVDSVAISMPPAAAAASYPGPPLQCAGCAGGVQECVDPGVAGGAGGALCVHHRGVADADAVLCRQLDQVADRMLAMMYAQQQ